MRHGSSGTKVPELPRFQRETDRDCHAERRLSLNLQDEGVLCGLRPTGVCRLEWHRAFRVLFK